MLKILLEIIFNAERSCLEIEENVKVKIDSILKDLKDLDEKLQDQY